MNTKVSFIKRFLSDTPDFFKAIQLIGVILLAVIKAVSGKFGISTDILSELNDIVLVGILIAQFAVKDIAALGDHPTLEGILQLLPDVADQVKQINDNLKAPVTINPVIFKADSAAVSLPTDNQTPQ